MADAAEDTARERYTATQRFEELYRTAELLVLDKPPDVRMDGDFPVTVEKYVQKAYPAMVEGPNRKVRFCHQLDYATSGVLCLAMTKILAARITHCFERRTTSKSYLALVHGHAQKGVVHSFDSPIAEDPTDPSGFRMCVGVEKPPAKKKKDDASDEEGGPEEEEPSPCPSPGLPVGRSALTHAVVLKHGYLEGKDKALLPASLVVLLPRTGRRHQLRVHCLSWGHPVCGDVCYHPEDKEHHIPRMMLHAWKLFVPADVTDTESVGKRELWKQRRERRAQKRTVVNLDGEAEELDAAKIEEDSLAELARGPQAELQHEDGQCVGVHIRALDRLSQFLK